MKDKVVHAPLDLDGFAADRPRIDGGLSRRVNADPESVERGLAQLVLTLVELLRQLMERQALDKRMEELRETFGLDEEDLNLHLGPLGRLL